LWRDEDLVAVYKPAGLLSHPSADPRRSDLMSWLREQVEAEQLVMHHRLDRETSGLLVMTLSKRACAPLAQSIAEGRWQKTYLAWVVGNPPRQGRVDLALGEVRGRVKVDRGGKAAITDFVRQRQAGRYALLRLQPRQGRKHQLRVHCQSMGWPIVGDTLYGGEASSRLWLHAWKLQLAHPVTGEKLNLECPVSQPWSSLGGVLADK
jgi:RluA family pseudouridine synthase